LFYTLGFKVTFIIQDKNLNILKTPVFRDNVSCRSASSWQRGKKTLYIQFKGSAFQEV